MGVPPNRFRKKKRVTITDVALEAKVSIAAVSRILNNNYEGFSAREETKARVLEAARRLGYRPSRAAISLATGRHDAIALCLPASQFGSGPVNVSSMDQVFQQFEMMLVISGLRRGLIDHHQDLILVDAAKERRPDEFVLQLQDKVDGVIWVNPDDEADTLNEILNAGLPLAVVGSSPVTGNFVNVRADEHTAGRMGMGHVLIRGAKTVLVAVPKERANQVGIKERIEGAKKAANDFTKSKVAAQTLLVPRDTAKGRVVFAEYLDKKGIPDAILTLDGHLPFAILSELYERDFDVPNDLLLVGFEENPLYSVNAPSLTGLRYPMEQLCYEAAAALMQLIATGEVPEPVLRVPQLIARASAP
ncbi:MAG: LacI family DNA-binding transcriptional regulator [Candidatus Sumerlaeia bacterium]|nr:LacI family DNA-binding transcriptional regulator [Candidatus Sumerlaeia bacterium]